MQFQADKAVAGWNWVQMTLEDIGTEDDGDEKGNDDDDQNHEDDDYDEILTKLDHEYDNGYGFDDDDDDRMELGANDI